MTNANKLKQLIQIGKKQLQLDDGTYREILQTQTGKDSTKKMTLTELTQVLDHLKSKGFKVTPSKKTKAKASTLKQADDAQSKKIRSLWLQLHEMGVVRDSSERALAKYVERQTSISALQFLSTQHASAVIESLKQWKSRVEDKQKQ